MIVKDFYINIEQTLQSLTSFSYDDIEAEELDIAVNKCLLRKVERILDNTGEQGFEGSSPNLNNLRKLLAKKDLVYTDTKQEGGVNVLTYTLPLDYFRYIGFKVEFEFVRECTNEYTGVTTAKPYKGNVRIVETQHIDDNLEDSTRASTKDSLIASIFDNFLYIYGNFKNTEIKSVFIRYAKEPTKIVYSRDKDVDYPMPNSFMEEVADETALHLSKLIEAEDKVRFLTSENIK
jgi:hypothetical protein